MIRILLVRHAQTRENVARRLLGHRHGTLTPLGIQQGEKLAWRLAAFPVRAIFCSDLTRNRTLARQIATKHPHARLIVTRLLRERKLGEMEGQNVDRLLRERPELFTTHKPKGGESPPELLNRARRALAFVKKRTRDGSTVVIVGNAVLNNAIRCALEGTPIERTWNDSTNASFSDIQWGKRSARVHTWSDTSHLS